MIDHIIAAAIMLWSALMAVPVAPEHQGQIVAAGMSVAWHESRWQADARGDNGCSLGYMQLNRCGGLGAPYSEAELLDGPTSARLFAEYVAVHLAAGYSITDTLAPWSVRSQALEMMRGMEGADVWEWLDVLPPGVVPHVATVER